MPGPNLPRTKSEVQLSSVESQPGCVGMGGLCPLKFPIKGLCGQRFEAFLRCQPLFAQYFFCTDQHSQVSHEIHKELSTHDLEVFNL